MSWTESWHEDDAAPRSVTGTTTSVRRSDMSEPPGVDLEEDVPDLVVRHRDEDGGGGAAVLVGHDGRLPVERALAEPRRGADPLPSDHLEQRRNLAPADDGPAYVADAAVTHRSRSRVGDQDCVLREHLQQCVLVAAGGGLDERRQQATVLVVGGLEEPPPGGDVLPGALEELAAGRIALPQQRADLRVAQVEDVVQQERG